jgi:hypothetical protein
MNKTPQRQVITSGKQRQPTKLKNPHLINFVEYFYVENYPDFCFFVMKYYNCEQNLQAKIDELKVLKLKPEFKVLYAY